MKRVSRQLLLLLIACGFPFAALSGEPIWIDVRTAGEFESGHVAEAILIPYDQIASEIESVTTDKNQLIYLYCRSGRRSGIATNVLEDLGYTNAVNVGGLEQALQKSGQAADSRP